MKKVAIYSRKSVLVEGSVSIETQINMCKDYINNKFPNAKFKVFEDKVFHVEILIDLPFKKCLEWLN